MHTTLRKHLPLGPVFAGMMAILVSGVAIGSLTFSAPQGGLLSLFAETPLAAATPSRPGQRAQRPCTGCGVIQSTRNIGGNDAGAANSADLASRRGHEITVLLQDGSTRVITDTNAAKWRNGERVTLIAGIDG